LSAEPTNHEPPAISHQPSAIDNQPSAIDNQPSAIENPNGFNEQSAIENPQSGLPIARKILRTHLRDASRRAQACFHQDLARERKKTAAAWRA
jgi:hypothetical protein